MTRACDSCGHSYDAKTKRSKFCSDVCRVRASRGAKPGHGSVSAVANAAETELRVAGRLETAMGQSVMALARRIDEGRDTGAALASLVRQLQVALAAATEGARSAASPLDELRARRERRLGA